MPAEAQLDPADFRRRLMRWYRREARVLPWRGISDPYRIWVSEVMLQQTRVAAVIDRYKEFVLRFPTLVSLSLASEPEVLAAWSGLGYYRRARMLHKAAQFIVLERDGRLPGTMAELRTLPGIGDYTAAAIASIAFGEPVAVVDGNVERVILRIVGRANDASAATRAFVRQQAQALMTAGLCAGRPATKRREHRWTAEERLALAAKTQPHQQAGAVEAAARSAAHRAGDHNQAMMELGAMVCLPRSPLCGECPVFALCLTRGEHGTPSRTPQQSMAAAYRLELRKQGTATEVLLSQRAADASIMPGMYELPPLAAGAEAGREPALRLRHSITNTNYMVQIFACVPQKKTKKQADEERRGKMTKAPDGLHWVKTKQLPGLPLTGLARKALQRLKLMDTARMNILE